MCAAGNLDFRRSELSMKRTDSNLATEGINEEFKPAVKENGRSQARSQSGSANLNAILMALQTIRDGDFSVRLPGAWVGVEGKLADTFNDIVASNQQMAQELRRVGRGVGKGGRKRERAKFHESKGAWGEMEVSINTLVEDLLRPTAEVTRAIAAVAQGNLTQTVRLDVDGRPLEGEFLRSATIVNTMIQQLGVFTAEVTRVAREVGTDGKLGGQAQVPGGAGALERFDRFGQLHGQQSDGPGEKHCGSGDGGGQRRLVAQDYGGRTRGNFAAQRSHQHDGGSAAVVRVGSYACGARGRYGWKVGRAGGSAGRGGHVERLDGLGKRHGRQLNGAGA